MPPFRSRPPYVMSEMIAAEPAVAERLVRRLAKDPVLDRVASEIRAAVDAGRPVVTTGCGTSEHAAMAIAMLVSDALDLPAGSEVRSVQALETLRTADRRRAAAGGLARGRHARDERGDPCRPGGRGDDRADHRRAWIARRCPRRPRDPHRGAGPELVPHRRVPRAARRRASRWRRSCAGRGSTPRPSAPSSTSARTPMAAAEIAAAMAGTDRLIVVGSGPDADHRPRARPQGERRCAPARHRPRARDRPARPPRRRHPLDRARRRR